MNCYSKTSFAGMLRSGRYTPKSGEGTSSFNISGLLMVIITLNVFAFSPVLGQLKKHDHIENLAVFPFDARGVSEIEALAITDRIRYYVQNSENYNVIERDKMNLILKEQAFQLTGLCLESECLVEAGKLLAVTKMIGGSVTKIGKLYSIEARIIDVESGQIIKSTFEDFDGPIELLLTNIAKLVAGRLIGGIIKDESLLKGDADLIVSSEPPGGSIYIDGSPIGAITPFTIRGISSGKHVVKVEKDNLVSRQNVDIFAGDIKSVRLNLSEKYYTLKIHTEPQGAEIRINGDVLYSETPSDVQLPREFSDSVEVILELDNYVIEKNYVYLGEQYIIRLSSILERAGKININDAPTKKGTEVYIDGEKAGITPFSYNHLSMGKHKIRVLSDITEEDYEVEIVITAENREVNLYPSFKKKQGVLNVAVEPDASLIFIDGSFAGNSPLESGKIFWGEHTIEVKKKGFYKNKLRVKVFQNEPLSYRFSLKPKSKKRAVLYSFLLPGSGQGYSGNDTRGLSFIMINAFTIGGAIYSRIQYNTASDQYNSDRNAYEKARTAEDIEFWLNSARSSFDNADRKKKITDGLTGLAGLNWFYTIIDAYISFPKIDLGGGFSSGKEGIEFLSHVGSTESGIGVILNF